MEVLGLDVAPSVFDAGLFDFGEIGGICAMIISPKKVDDTPPYGKSDSFTQIKNYIFYSPIAFLRSRLRTSFLSI